jgi:hypothetical protein
MSAVDYKALLEANFEKFAKTVKMAPDARKTPDEFAGLVAVKFTLTSAIDTTEKLLQHQQDFKEDSLEFWRFFLASQRIQEAWAGMKYPESRVKKPVDRVLRLLEELTEPTVAELDLAQEDDGQMIRATTADFTAIREFLESHVPAAA